jgi:hypothetical protein
MRTALCLAICLSYTSQAYGEKGALTFRGSMSWLQGVKADTPAPSDINPDNQLGLVRDRQGVSEIRPNLRLSASQIQLIARPRIRYEALRTTSLGTSSDVTSLTDTEMREAFLQWTLSDQVTFAYGLQNYQWGGAESLSPSNRMFHETAVQRTALYEARGKNLVRMNFSIGKSFSTVLMADVEEQKDEEPWQSGETWQPTALLKPELNWNNGADYVGLVLGARAEGKPWVGEYFSYGVPFMEGVTIFADASHERGSQAWRPVVGTEGRTTDFKQRLSDDKSIKTIAAGGLKYDFIGGAIIRFEHVFNQPGFSTRERDEAKAALLSPLPQDRLAFSDNLARYLSPGLELPGQRYWYTSLHIPDFLNITDLTFAGRVLHAVSDGSKSVYSNLDYKIGDSGTLSIAIAKTNGQKDSELRSFSDQSQTITYRYDW